MLTGFYACQQADDSITPQEEAVNRIFIRPIFPDVEISVKSGEVNIGKDIIYAYPFQVSTEFDGVAIAPDSISSVSYSYYLPKTKEDIVFTNAIEESGSYQILPNNDSHYLEFSLQDTLGGSNTDLVVGTLAMEDMIDSTIHPVSLKRVACKFTIKLKMITKAGTPITDLSQYLKKASLKISPLNRKYIIQDDLTDSYSEECSVIWTNDSIAEGDSVIHICQNSFTLPSVSSNLPELNLLLETPNGQIQQLDKTMTYTVDANKHYKLTLLVRLKSTAFDFVFEDFIEEEIIVDDFEDVTAN